MFIRVMNNLENVLCCYLGVFKVDDQIIDKEERFQRWIIYLGLLIMYYFCYDKEDEYYDKIKYYRYN